MIEELREQMRRNSSNSNQPPSSDPPAARQERGGKPGSGRKRGGQPGHDPHRRELVPPDKVRRIVDCYPTRCRRCEAPLAQRAEGEPWVHQVIEVPPIVPDTDEYRRYRVRCEGCGEVTCGALPDGVPATTCGPRLTAMLALLTAAYHLSRRQAQSLTRDVLGVPLSLGVVSESEERISEAVAPAVEEVVDYACRQPVKHVDATGWRLAGASRTLWTIATSMVTAFTITINGSRAELRKVLRVVLGYLVSDRGTQFGFWAMDKRQVCWAHLIRKFVSFSERGAAVGSLGDDLLIWAGYLLERWRWVKDRDGPRRRRRFVREAQVVRAKIEALLRRGEDMRVRGVSGSCKDMLEHCDAMWTFVTVADVDPTNNHAERELRGFVLWRKKSFGSQSQRGVNFAQRLMTVVHTLRKQGRHVLSYLTDAYQAALRDSAAPSLLPNR